MGVSLACLLRVCCASLVQVLARHLVQLRSPPRSPDEVTPESTSRGGVGRHGGVGSAVLGPRRSPASKAARQQGSRRDSVSLATAATI